MSCVADVRSLPQPASVVLFPPVLSVPLHFPKRESWFLSFIHFPTPYGLPQEWTRLIRVHCSWLVIGRRPSTTPRNPGNIPGHSWCCQPCISNCHYCCPANMQHGQPRKSDGGPHPPPSVAMCTSSPYVKWDFLGEGQGFLASPTIDSHVCRHCEMRYNFLRNRVSSFFYLRK